MNKRNERLKADFYDMLALQDRPYISWTAIKGEPPYVEEYLLNIRLRTYAIRAQSGKYTVGVINNCAVTVTLRDSYPDVAPYIRMPGFPPVFHPAWYSKGVYCPAERWRPEESLKEHIGTMLGTLMYEPTLAELDIPANYKALEWYIKNRDNAALFPSDHTQLTENSPEQIAALEKAAFSFEETVDTNI